MTRYPSKILLFGEYAIIHQSMALAIPYYGYEGLWKNGTSIHDTSDFAAHLDDLEIEDILFDYNLYELDKSEGLQFVSSIPQGYGVGSSGALTAAFYERYLIRNREFPIAELKTIFAEMESFFHGSSSGFDPLISYLNNGLILKADKSLEVIQNDKRKNFVFYLVNSRKPRATAPLVERYHEKYKSPLFQRQITELVKLNALAISYYQNNSDLLLDVFQEISKLQNEHFKEMIIPSMEENYKKLGLKLCGAGGGGFYLGLTKREQIPTLIKKQDVILLE